jgi:hypothetical protein
MSPSWYGVVHKAVRSRGWAATEAARAFWPTAPRAINGLYSRVADSGRLTALQRASHRVTGMPQAGRPREVLGQTKKSTVAVLMLYIAPAILMAPTVSKSASTALRLRISPMVSSTFLRATASTKS